MINNELLKAYKDALLKFTIQKKELANQAIDILKKYILPGGRIDVTDYCEYLADAEIGVFYESTVEVVVDTLFLGDDGELYVNCHEHDEYHDEPERYDNIPISKLHDESIIYLLGNLDIFE